MTNPETSSELVAAKLRSAGGFMREAGANDDADMCDEAATTIERLTRQVATEHAFFLVEAEKHSEWLENYMAMKARAEAAESLAARQAEALKDIAETAEISVRANGSAAFNVQILGNVLTNIAVIARSATESSTKGPSNG